MAKSAGRLAWEQYKNQRAQNLASSAGRSAWEEYKNSDSYRALSERSRQEQITRQAEELGAKRAAERRHEEYLNSPQYQAASRLAVNMPAAERRRNEPLTGTERRDFAAQQAQIEEDLDTLELYENMGLTGTERREKAETQAAAAERAAAEEYQRRNKGLTGTERLAPMRELEQKQAALEAERADMYANPGNYFWTEPLTGTERREQGFDQTNRYDYGVEMGKKGAEYDREIAEVEEQIAQLRATDYQNMIYNPDFEKYVEIGEDIESDIRPEDVEGSYSYFDFLNNDEQDIFNYLLGKYGEDSANAYWEIARTTAQHRYGQKVAGAIENSNWRTGALIANSLGTGVTNWMEGILGAFGALTGQEVAENGLNYASPYIKENLGTFGNVAYDLGVTVGNMLPSIMIGGGLGNASMGISAGGSAYQQGIREGMSRSEALAYGTLVGVSESYLQPAMGGISRLGGSGGKLAKAASGIENGFLRFIAKTGGSMISEGAEEGLQAILEPIFNSLVSGGDPDIDWSEVAYNALMGALMGGVFEGTNNARIAINETREGKKFASYGEDAVPELVKSGLESAPETESFRMATEMQAKLDKGEKIGNREIAKLQQANEEAIFAEEKAEAEKAETERWRAESAKPDFVKEDELRQKVLNTAQKTLGKEGYTAFEAAVRETSEPAAYYGELTRAYNDGMVNKAKNLGKQLTQAQYDAMYTAGKADAAASIEALAKKKGIVTTYNGDSGVDYNDAGTKEYVAKNLDKKTASALDTVAKALGIKVRFADSVAGGTANAQIERGVVLIEKGNPNPVRFLFGHEITHRMQELAPAEYARLRESVAARGDWMDAAIKKVQANYARHGKSISNEAAMDEAVADYVGTLLEDSGELERFIGMNKNDRGLLQKLKDFVRKLVIKFKGTEYEKQLRNVEKRLTETLNAAKAQAAENQKAKKNAAQESDGGVAKNSLKIVRTDGTVEILASARSLTNEQAINYLKQAKRGLLKGDAYIPVRKDTPEVIIDTLSAAEEEVFDRSFLMQVRKAQQAMSTTYAGNKKRGNNARGHALTPEEVVEILNNLDNPNAIILQTNRWGKNGKPLPNNVAVFVEYNNGEGVAVIEFESSINPEYIGLEYGDTQFHTVVTVFEPDTERDGLPFDYAEELLSNPDNIELEIVRRQPEGSATREKHPNTSDELPSVEVKVPQKTPVVKTGNTGGKLSLKESTAKKLDAKGLTVQNGVIVSKANAALVQRDGYFTPNDRDSVRYSVKTEPEWRKNYLALHKGKDAERVANVMRTFTERMIANDAIFNYVPNGDYSYSKFGPLRDNMEYIFTFDMDTSCPRTFQFLNYRNALRHIAGRELTYNESVNLLEVMRAYGQQIPCAYCYVENKRILLSASYNNFFKFRQDVMNATTDEEALTKMYSYDPKKGKVSSAAQKVFERWRSDTSYNPSVTEVWTATNEARNAVLNFLDAERKAGRATPNGNMKALQKKVFDRFGITNAKSAEALEVESFINDWVYDTKAKTQHIYNIPNSETVPETIDLRALRLNREALGYSKSASSAKTVENYTPYTDQLKNVSEEDRNYIMGMGGIRKHSSNDFRIDYVQDYFLFYADLAAGKWTGHTYTKSVDFAKIFGRTGDRINMSVAFYGDSKETLRQNIDEGAPWRDVKELRKHYKDVGSMAMVTNDVQLSYAMNADWIDMIIPFHASGLDKAVWYDLRMWQDYTSKQSERFKNADDMKSELAAAGIAFDKKASADDIRTLYNESFGIKQILTYDKDGNLKLDKNGNPVLHKPHFFPGDTYVDGQLVPGHGNDPKRYFQLCQEYGVHPRFKGVKVEDAKGRRIDVTEHPGYIKLIKETSRIDSKQKPIEFNLDQHDDFLGMSPMEYAFKRMEEEAKNGGFENTKEDPYGIVKEFAEEYIGKDRPLGYLTDRAKATRDILNEGYQEMAYAADEAVAEALGSGAKLSIKDNYAPVGQAISSAKTSIMQIPALFKDKNVVWGKTNIDIGGGRFDLAKNYLAERGVKSMIFDPYNRGAEENSETLGFLQSGKRADTATCANVLNVIAEPAARSNVILEVAKAIKPDGVAYFMVYEGNGSGEGKQTSAGWQNNRKTADYVGEISDWFETVQRKGKLIIAKNPVSDLPQAAWEIQPGEAVRFSLKDSDSLAREIARIQKDGKKNKRSDADIQTAIRAVVQEAYEGMVSEYGAIDPGENPYREVQVPKRTAKNKKVSQTVRTILEAQATPDEALPKIEEMVAKGEFSYEVYGDEQAISDAREAIEGNWGEATRKWFNDVAAGVVSKRNTTIGWLLYDNAANSGDTQLALEILNAMVEHQRSAAQAVQATRILKKLSPETQLYSVTQTVKKLQRELDEKGLGKKNAKNAGAAAEAVDEAKREATSEIAKVYKNGKVSRRGNKVVVEGNQAGEPFVFEYAQKVGESIAKSLDAKRNATKKEQTFLQHISSQLKRFANEKLPPAEKGKSITAVDMLRDYIQNQAFYNEAWEAAQQELRDKYADDAMLGEFINSGIGVDANINPRNAIFMKALVKSATESKETKANIIRQSTLGVTKISENIAAKLIAETGAEGEMAQTIRDAAAGYVHDIMVEAETNAEKPLEAEKLITSAVKGAMKDIGVTLSQAVTTGNGAAVKQAIIDKLVTKYAFGLAEATNTAEIVGQQFDAMSRKFAENKLKSMFKKREHKQKTIAEQMELLGNLGAFEMGSAYNSAAAERVFKQGANLHIDEELAAKFLQAETQEARDEILKDIYRDIGKQMPSTFVDKFRAWRYLAMLGNARTHGRNIAGNALFAPVVLAKDMTATAIESAVYYVSGKKTQRSKSLAVSKDLLKAAWDDYANVADLVSGEGKYNDLANANKYIEEGRRVFKNKALEAARRGNSKALEKEDAWFSRPHYAFALAQYCKAHGITAEQLRKGKALGEAARAYAIKEAQKATYRDTNQFSQLVSGLRFKNPDTTAKKAVNLASEGILPFRKTPANILVRGIEYSPIGLVTGIKQAVWDVHRGTKTSAEAIDSISSGLTGTGLLALGVYLAAQGLVRGHGGDDEDEREFKELMGHQNYALELPNGKSYTLDWMAPEALPFFIGVNLYEQTQGGKEDMQLKDVWSAVWNITEPLLEMSCLQSLNDVFDAAGYASNNDMPEIMSGISSAATSFLTQALPTLLGQAERTGESERMTTYTEKDSPLTGDMQYFLGKASARIPVWDFQQIPFIDAWGRTESTGGKGERAFNNFLNPAYTSQIETSDMEEALLDLYEITGEAGIFPSRAAKYFTVGGERKDLTAEEYVTYATEKGQTAYKLLTNLTSSSAYAALDDAGKVEAIKRVYEYANAFAKTTVSDYKPDGWVAKAIEAGKTANIKPEQYVMAYMAQNSVGSYKDADGDTIPNSHSLLVMQMVYNIPGLNEEQRQALYVAFDVSESVRHYNKALVEQKLAEMERKAK